MEKHFTGTATAAKRAGAAALAALVFLGLCAGLFAALALALPARARAAYDPSVYTTADVEVVNAIIGSNGLAGYSADDPANWDFTQWNADSPRRLTGLALNEKGLYGALDLRGASALETLNCWNNRLTALDLSQNTALVTLECGSNQLATLDLSQNGALRTLGCSNNRLATLGLSQNTLLEALSCTFNQLTTLDLSRNALLKSLTCTYNQLATLDLSQNTALT